MRLAAALLTVLYLAAPVSLLAYGGVDSLWTGVVVLLRGLAISVVVLAVGLGVSKKIRFLQQDGLAFYARFYLIYLVLFLVFAFILGLEIQFPDQHKAGRYSY